MAIRFHVIITFVYLIVRTSACSNLRQMRDTDHLPFLLSHLLHDIRHPIGDFTGNTGIDFIEHNGGKFYRTGYHGLNRQHDSGYFTAGSHRRDVLQRTVLIGREKETHCIFPLHSGFLA